MIVIENITENRYKEINTNADAKRKRLIQMWSNQRKQKYKNYHNFWKGKHSYGKLVGRNNIDSEYNSLINVA